MWKPIDVNGNEHKHKFNMQINTKPIFQRRKIVDIAYSYRHTRRKEIAFTRVGV